MIEIETNQNIKLEVVEDLLISLEEKGFTYLHCEYVTSQSGMSVNICRTSYLIVGGIKYYLIHSINIPNSPQRFYLKNRGERIKFTLIFPMLPKGCEVFDFIEESKDQFSFSKKNIKRNSIGIYNVNVALS